MSPCEMAVGGMTYFGLTVAVIVSTERFRSET